VVANQRGYAGLGAGRKRAETKTRIMEAGTEGWELVESRKSWEEEQGQAVDAQAETIHDDESDVGAKPMEASFLHRMARLIQSVRGWQQ
jgi:hypothetical protein